MKNLSILLLLLFAVGCGKDKQPPAAKAQRERMAMKAIEEALVKRLEESVVGEYEFKGEGAIYKFVLLANGKVEDYIDGEQPISTYETHKWSIVDGEIHVIEKQTSYITVWSINPRFLPVNISPESITHIAVIKDGNRTKVWSAIEGVEGKPYKKIK